MGRPPGELESPPVVGGGALTSKGIVDLKGFLVWLGFNLQICFHVCNISEL